MSDLLALLADRTIDPPISRESLADEAADRLRHLIKTDKLAPGTRLVETSLARLLGVSRGPVREALRKLDREGLVVIQPHKGAVVAEWSLDDLLDAYDIRALLEVRAVELATERSARACVAELDPILTAWDTAAATGDRERCADLDVDFHHAVWRAAKNRALLDVLLQTIHPLQTVFYLNATRYDDQIEVVALHRDVRDGIATLNPNTARRAMEAHMRNSLAKSRRHGEHVRTTEGEEDDPASTRG
jgi:DNA-binding GntR family transcriptional regulator